MFYYINGFFINNNMILIYYDRYRITVVINKKNV